MQCILVTPERTVRDEEADFVALTLFDGEIGIGPGHTPMIGRLGYGEMRIVRDKQTVRYYVEGGFVEVAEDVVSVLAGRAVPADGDRRGRGRGAASLCSGQAGPYAGAGGRRRRVQAQAQLRVARRTVLKRATAVSAVPAWLAAWGTAGSRGTSPCDLL